jgi:hypothetical protein
MQIDLVAVWGLLAAVFFLASLGILAMAQKKLLKGELKNLVFWIYALILTMLLVIVMLVAVSFLEIKESNTLRLVQGLITFFIIVSGLCAVRVSMLFLSFAKLYGFADNFREKALKMKKKH